MPVDDVRARRGGRRPRRARPARARRQARPGAAVTPHAPATTAVARRRHATPARPAPPRRSVGLGRRSGSTRRPTPTSWPRAAATRPGTRRLGNPTNAAVAADAGGAGGRGGGAALRAPAWRRSRARCTRCRTARQPRGRRARALRRHVHAAHARAARRAAARSSSCRWPTSTPGGDALGRPAGLVYVETPLQPDAARRRPAARSPSWRTRPGRPAVVDATFTSPSTSGRSSTASTSCCTRRRSTSTATPTWSAGVVAGLARTSSSGCGASSEPLGACLDPRVGEPAGARPEDARACAWSATTPARSRSPRGWRRRPEVAGGRVPAAGRRIPTTRWPRRLLRGGSGMVTFRVRGGDGRRCACSTGSG